MLDITRFLSTIFPFQFLLILKNSEKPVLKLVISYKKGNVSKEWRNFAEDRRRSVIKVHFIALACTIFAKYTEKNIIRKMKKLSIVLLLCCQCLAALAGEPLSLDSCRAMALRLSLIHI